MSKGVLKNADIIIFEKWPYMAIYFGGLTRFVLLASVKIANVNQVWLAEAGTRLTITFQASLLIEILIPYDTSIVNGFGTQNNSAFFWKTAADDSTSLCISKSTQLLRAQKKD